MGSFTKRSDVMPNLVNFPVVCSRLIHLHCPLRLIYIHTYIHTNIRR